jgi:predicted NBD/HSP70 family sugar kinase
MIIQKEFYVDIGIQNDANVYSLVKWMMGSVVGEKNTIYLTFGTGINAS